MPVIITGMHRSGTSMVARMLNLCGLYLGTAEQLIPTRPDNPEGFWELEEINEINNAILNRLGGSWDQPPKHDLKDFQGIADLEPLKLRAKQLVSDFAGCEPWGWKDPRTSLTLGFWREFLNVEKLKIIICLRNPVDVTKSLTARDTPIQFGYHLWDFYYQILQQNLAGIPYIITHYDSFFYDKQTELKRLVDFLELDISAEKFEEACGFLKSTLRNHVSTVVDLAESDAPLEVIENYLVLAQQAGPVFEELLAKQEISNPVKSLKITAPLSAESQKIILTTRTYHLKKELEAARLDNAIRSELRTEIERLDSEIRRLNGECLKLRTAYEQQIGANTELQQNFENTKKNSETTYANLEGAYNELAEEYKRLSGQSERLQQENSHLVQDLRALQNSRTVRLSNTLGGLVKKFSK